MITIYKTKAVAICGSKSKLADVLGIKRQAITGWPDRKPIPKKRAAQLVEIYGEEVWK